MLFGITTGETSKFFLVNSRRLTESDVGQLKRVELIEECIITKIYCMTRQTIVNRNKIHFYVLSHQHIFGWFQFFQTVLFWPLGPTTFETFKRIVHWLQRTFKCWIFWSTTSRFHGGSIFANRVLWAIYHRHFFMRTVYFKLLRPPILH